MATDPDATSRWLYCLISIAGAAFFVGLAWWQSGSNDHELYIIPLMCLALAFWMALKLLPADAD